MTKSDRPDRLGTSGECVLPEVTFVRVFTLTNANRNQATFRTREMSQCPKYDQWLTVALRPGVLEDIYALYAALETESRFGQYIAKRTMSGSLIVSSRKCKARLHLHGPAEKEYFLWLVDRRCPSRDDIPIRAIYPIREPESSWTN